MTRRSFLASTATAPLVITSAALGNAQIPPASDRITIGLIGAGNRGGDGLLHDFLPLPSCQFVAVCDPFLHRRHRRSGEIDDFYTRRFNTSSYKSAAMYADFRDLLNRKEIDAVCIATPDHWHVPMAIIAARAGKDVYVEKPLSPSLEQNLLARDVIHQTQRVFQYGTQQRGAKHVRFGCGLVNSGKIGKIKTAEVFAPSGHPGGNPNPMPVPAGLDWNMWQGPAIEHPYTDDRAWRPGHYHIYEYSLGYLGCWGAHPLDVFDWGLPNPTPPVACEGIGLIPNRGLYDTVMDWTVRFEYADQMRMTFRVGPDSTEFVGTEGSVKIGRYSIDAKPKSLLAGLEGISTFAEMGAAHCQNFLDSVKQRKPAESTIESAVRSDLLTQLSDAAVRTGRRIQFDAGTEKIIGDEEAQRLLARPTRGPWLSKAS